MILSFGLFKIRIFLNLFYLHNKLKFKRKIIFFSGFFVNEEDSTIHKWLKIQEFENLFIAKRG